jgi:hypothetical protein
VSVEAISWAFNLAPVPRDHNGKRNPACKAVLIGLANHAGPDGKDAFPSVRTLVRYTDLSERTVRNALDRLEAEGTIQPCDLEDEDLAALEKPVSRPYRPRPGSEESRQRSARQGGATAAPRSPDGGATAAATGCSHFRNGGAVVAPEPSIEPSRKPSAAPARTRERPGPVENPREAVPEVDDFFAGLGPQWPLTAGQRGRLAPAVAAALTVG